MGDPSIKQLAMFWAKSVDEGEGSLSLLQHASDVAGVIVPVAQKLVPKGRLDALQRNFGDVPWQNVLRFAAWAHDCGKISAYFQPKVPALYSRVRRAGYRSRATPQELSANPHSVVSAHAVKKWFTSRSGSKLGRGPIRGWVNVLAGHHGTFPNEVKTDGLEIEDANWQEARERFLDLGATRLGFGQEDVTALANLPWTVAEQVLVTGILIVADWVGSSEKYFPYDYVSGGGVSDDSGARLEQALERLDLGGVWRPEGMEAEDFPRRFGLPQNARMRSVQKAAIDVALAQQWPAFHLIENETGGGKTEAALAMAEILAAKFNLNGLYFAQPTRVTSDAMFSRVAQWLRTGGRDGATVSAILAHGKAEFNEEFQSMFDEALPRSVYDSEEGNPGVSIEATQWFRGRKTGLLASVVVGTIDQMLFAALRSKHAMLRHLGLAGKVVVIDEIHAADDFMQVYLTRILEWLGLYGVPVIALSATLPPAQREELTNAYRRGATEFSGSVIAPDNGNGYPRITSADSEGVHSIYPKADGRAKATAIEFLDGELDELAAAVLGESEKGGCIAVICSTVNRAQELHGLLAEQSGEVVLLHSRFTTDHRMERETDLVRQLGRRGDERPERLIVVSTQIIEQGLDLDFDLMFSDIAPVDLLIQRMGRLHRHTALEAQRPASMKRPRMIIVGAGIPDTMRPAPDFPRGIVAVYRAAPLLRSALVLTRHLESNDGLVVAPDHVADLVTDAYDDTLAPPEAWSPAWGKAHEKDRAYRTNQNQRAKLHRIPSAETGSLEDWSVAMSPAEEREGVAQVRDADESIEVVVVRRVGDRLYALPRLTALDGLPVDGTVSIDWSTARELARCTVRLPGWMVSESALMELESDGQESWQTSPWLVGQLPLVLDENLQRELGPWLLTYHEDRGLLMERIPEGEEGGMTILEKTKAGFRDD